MEALQSTATLTAKGQVTLPKAIRQSLGVDTGSRLLFTLREGVITVARADDEAAHSDNAVLQFLRLLEKDIRQEGGAGHLSEDLIQAMRSHAGDFSDNIEKLDIEGEVSL